MVSSALRSTVDDRSTISRPIIIHPPGILNVKIYNIRVCPETLSAMLGYVAKTINVQHGSTGLQDQEVFVIGSHGLYIHIACGHLTANVISRVHSNRCSENEVLVLEFMQGHGPQPVFEERFA
ncbi:hypothetical protein CIHG_09199 [Coccidioides immitis H538.4]|uniref:Uncharacterized protein n=3 Tax=Coccidioides immitis TaxID=5501 RepID=A0A0J8R605_COCIT|nr:hypothetical protein CIRG_05958 [Coccidioides immitis RMSCC 2394]KMU80519.1 hypothetical protein CISG_02370 [Coccidioides immitis RMSCC 3703]KMU91322.1 hypothetical protein CIHG_09199 [Coccidioides immitis H538.4]